MDNDARIAAYTKQNEGRRRELSPKQDRRQHHKSGRDVVSMLAVAQGLTRREAVKVVRSW